MVLRNTYRSIISCFNICHYLFFESKKTYSQAISSAKGRQQALEKEAELRKKNHQKELLRQSLRYNGVLLQQRKELLAVVIEKLESQGESIKKRKLKNVLVRSFQELVNARTTLDNDSTNLTTLDEEFLVSLTLKYPSLSRQELLICLYIRQGLTSKEIAHLKSVSLSAIEKARHRLRKKIMIVSSVSLQEYLRQL